MTKNMTAMKHSQTQTLNAFVIALAQLESISDELKENLSSLGTISPQNVNLLAKIAHEEPLLCEKYDTARQLLVESEGERTKGLVGEVQYDVERTSREVRNFVDPASRNRDPVRLAKEIVKEDSLLQSIANKFNQSGSNSPNPKGSTF